MTPKNDYITKKDLEKFGNKLELKIEQKLEQKLDKKFEKEFKKLECKLDKKLDEKFDVKFAEYFEILINSVNKTVYSALGLYRQEVDAKFEKVSYDLDLHSEKLAQHDRLITEHTHTA